MSFVNKDTAKCLIIEINLCFDNVSMATISLTENIYGCCNVNTTVKGSSYSEVKLIVLKNLCSDILLGQDFQSPHKQVIFQYERKKKDFCFLEYVCIGTSLSQAPFAISYFVKSL